MPWVTPTLEEVRTLNRDNVQSKLRSGPMIPNSVLRVMSDGNAGLAYLTLLYIDWLAKQFLPDTADKEWLDRQANIWIGGRKAATYAAITATATGIAGTLVPANTQFNAVVTGGSSVIFRTNTEITVGVAGSSVDLVALTPGATGLEIGNTISLNVGIAGLDGSATVTLVDDGIPEETDDELRVRVLDRIRQPPMGGDANDYVQWALEVPGVTRAWCSPQEMGIGTVTVRFMMDDLRASTNPMANGFPNSDDVAAVQAYIDTKRPASVKDCFIVAPLPQPVNFTISNLDTDNSATRAAIISAVNAMLISKAKPASAINGVAVPAQTIYSAWVSEAIMSASGVNSFDLTMSDLAMPSNGYMAVMGTINYA